MAEPGLILALSSWVLPNLQIPLDMWRVFATSYRSTSHRLANFLLLRHGLGIRYTSKRYYSCLHGTSAARSSRKSQAGCGNWPCNLFSIVKDEHGENSSLYFLLFVMLHFRCVHEEAAWPCTDLKDILSPLSLLLALYAKWSGLYGGINYSLDHSWTTEQFWNIWRYWLTILSWIY